jgi:small GTP-binding protein
MAKSTCGKVVVIGSTSVGKTAIITAVRRLPFNAGQASTIGAGSWIVERTVDGQQNSIELWDTAGQDAFASLVPYYVREARGALFVFSLADEASLETIPDWLDLVAGRECVPVLFLVGNKADCARAVAYEAAAAKAEELGLRYFETSAKTGSGIEDLVVELIAALAPLPRTASGENVVSLEPAGPADARRRGCC